MGINYKQAQFELFPGAVSSADKPGRPTFLFSSVTLSLENLVIVGIFFVMSIVFAFSLGIHRGMKTGIITQTAVQNLPSEKSVTHKAVVVPSANKEAQNINSSATIKKTAPLKINPPVVVPKQDINEGIQNAYTIQVASYKTRESAQREALLLKNKGYDIFVVPKGNYVILCVGKFAGKSQADVLLGKLRKSYKDCYWESEVF